MSWKEDVLDQNKIKEKINGGEIIKWKTPDSLSFDFHRKMDKGAVLRELQHQHLHLSYWESKYYKKAISRYLKTVDPEKSICIDIGCGDGRFTELLLEKGFEKIIATDIDSEPLKSLRDYLRKKNLEDRVLLLQASADSLPIKNNIADVVLAIGVFYYLNDDFGKALSKAVSKLKEKGILINSEPTLEGAVYKSLFFETLADVIENFDDRKFKEEKGKTPYKFRLFSEEEIRSCLENEGLTILDSHGLSLLPSILRIKMVRGEISKKEVTECEEKIRKIFNYFDEKGSLNKHIIWKSIKQ